MSEIRPRRSVLAMPGSDARAIAKAAALAADAVLLDPADGAFSGLHEAAECAQGRDLGFGGKVLIHPGRIDPANAASGRDAAEIADARRVIDAFGSPENRERGVIALGGRRVERPHVEAARRTLALAGAIETPAR